MLAVNWFKIFYWVTVADGVKSFFDVASNIFTWFAVITFVVYGILVGIKMDIGTRNGRDDEEYKSIASWSKGIGRTVSILIIMSIITWMGYVFCPSKKDALIIVAGGAVGNFITSDSSAKQIPSELTLLIREKMRSEIQELKTPSLSTTVDTLAGKSKEELIEMIKNKK